MHILDAHAHRIPTAPAFSLPMAQVHTAAGSGGTPRKLGSWPQSDPVFLATSRTSQPAKALVERDASGGFSGPDSRTGPATNLVRCNDTSGGLAALRLDRPRHGM
ncbi:hypothetical protein J7T55_009796 [Diaporthe amygdali]|uniref:uncharacterized protein n=1 Tax=Phomopsis amygdali TaxID=1214568 RepID=UPI0022FDCE3E|nr:uncharacterized protein J7T55_009796 [Diaporthe amygdali]KAJ0116646.1 hypothetical protein J7T55_009796 [Diaporthe amygdali]